MGSAVRTGGPRRARSPHRERVVPLVSRRAYARMRGVSEKAVRKAIDAGKIPLVDGMIDPVVADASWSRNRDGGQQSKLAEAITGSAAAGEQGTTGAADPVASSDTPARREPETQTAPLTQARIEQVQVTTAIREITRKKLEGDLLEREEVERTWGELFQAVKDRLRLIPDNIGDVLAGTSDAAECRSIVMKEILDALSAASKTVEGMAA